jgi:hypothetical protein
MRDLTNVKNPSTANARQASALLVFAIMFWNIGDGYCKDGGGRDPITIIGAPGIGEPPKPVVGCRIGTVENGTWDAKKACRNVWPSWLLLSGRVIPNIIELAGFSELGSICQWAFPNICEIWIARNNASGSPSIYCKFTDLGAAAKICSIFDATDCEMVRHATTAFIFLFLIDYQPLLFPILRLSGGFASFKSFLFCFCYLSFNSQLIFIKLIFCSSIFRSL